MSEGQKKPCAREAGGGRHKTSVRNKRFERRKQDAREMRGPKGDRALSVHNGRAMSSRTDALQRVRLKQALSFLLCCACAIALPQLLGSTACDGFRTGASSVVSVPAEAMRARADPVHAASSAQEFVASIMRADEFALQLNTSDDLTGAGALPAHVAREAFIPVSAESCLVDETGRIVAYSRPGSPEFVLEELRVGMELAGWRTVPLGGIAGMTFLKEDGELRWALATSTTVARIPTVGTGASEAADVVEVEDAAGEASNELPPAVVETHASSQSEGEAFVVIRFAA